MKIGDRVIYYRNNYKRTGAPDYLVGKSGVLLEVFANWFAISFDNQDSVFFLPPSYLKYEVKEQKNG